MECQICAFKNPKVTVSAIILHDNKLLLLKRNQEPFLGKWDLPGGFMQEGELPEQALKRELQEELGVDEMNLTFMQSLPETYTWKEQEIPVLNHFYLSEITGDIRVDQKENSDHTFISLHDLNSQDVAFAANQTMAAWLKEHFAFDMERVRELVKQLDASTVVNEHYLYKAMLNGFVSKIYEGEKLIGLGWIFARQTMQRKQAVVEDMIVDNAYRGKGYGKKMLQELIAWAKSQGVEVIELTSHPSRVAANELYKKTGFTLHPTNHYLYAIKNI